MLRFFRYRPGRRICLLFQKIVISWLSCRVEAERYDGAGGGQPWCASKTAHCTAQLVSSPSGAFFAAPECGNAAAGGAAEIATRHPPGHNASRDIQLCFTIRDDMCLTYIRTSSRRNKVKLYTFIRYLDSLSMINTRKHPADIGDGHEWALRPLLLFTNALFAMERKHRQHEDSHTLVIYKL